MAIGLDAKRTPPLASSHQRLTSFSVGVRINGEESALSSLEVSVVAMRALRAEVESCSLITTSPASTIPSAPPTGMGSRFQDTRIGLYKPFAIDVVEWHRLSGVR